MTRDLFIGIFVGASVVGLAIVGAALMEMWM